MDPYLRDVLDVLLRMLHVTAGIAWIGASFYFVRLDLSLRAPKRAEDADRGIAGEFWGVHGGGLYHSQKYRLAPAELPEPLHWFKWEAYTTWLSGFALMVVLYYFDAGVRLVDPTVADLADLSAIALSVGGLALAWVVYDVLCRTLGQRSQLALAIIGVALVAVAAWSASELFAARAAYVQVGAMLGTVMAANVLFVIIPAHRKLVAAMANRREPDPVPLLEAKRRSVHNNYLTLPVLFTMLAGHFAFTFGADEAWLVLVLIAVLTAGVRHFFNLWHTGRRAWWILGVAAAAVVALALWLQPDEVTPVDAGPVAFEQVQAVIEDRCATCHSGASAPLGLRLETEADITARADDIERQAVQTRAMPPGNSTGMTKDERELLGAWLAQPN
ncbi:MAG: urate hydroxylase PuuD [Actinomycetota bacterium]|nr:urate hydroxylase PuuD [Actinomycetota bacterium]